MGRAEAGLRLDKALAQRLQIGRDRLKELLAAGLVQVDGCAAKPSLLLAEGMVIEAAIPQRPPLSLAPQPIPLEILYEDDFLIAVNKPSGMVVHPAPGNPDRTLVNALLHHCRTLSQAGGIARPGIVHRLDKDTSGLLLAAKDDLTHRRLSQQFQDREVEKTYLALALGPLAEACGTIRRAIGRDPKQRKKISSRSRRAKEAVTHWRVRERFGPLVFLQIRLETGRTHQIRVHLSEAGHPLIGDPIYGGRRRLLEPYAGLCHSFGRLALHAWRIAFVHPQRRERVELTAPLPDDFEQLLDSLRRQAGTAKR